MRTDPDILERVRAWMEAQRMLEDTDTLLCALNTHHLNVRAKDRLITDNPYHLINEIRVRNSFLINLY